MTTASSPEEIEDLLEDEYQTLFVDGPLGPGMNDHLGCYLTVHPERGTFCPIHVLWIEATDPSEGSE